MKVKKPFRRRRRSNKGLRRKSRVKKKSLLRRGIFIGVVILSCVVVLQLLAPDVSKLRKENPKKTAMMEYREKESLRKGKKYGITQNWVPYGLISPYLVKAVIIGEDDKFWHHEGFDYEAIEKAIEKDVRSGKFKAGGSTITQQLAKNLYLSPSKNPLRKVREAVIAWQLERTLSKKRILELYLNTAEWGEGIFGIEAASRHYYGKPASELGPEEAARLAAVLPNPRKYSPMDDSRYVDARAGVIYRIMVKRGAVIPRETETPESQILEELLPSVSPEGGMAQED
jgi:monofunctional biosynthetic peptidoglycan transglycosylase